MDTNQKSGLWDKILSQLRGKAEASPYDNFKQLKPRETALPDADKTKDAEESLRRAFGK